MRINQITLDAALAKLKQIKPQQALYPAIVGVFSLTVIVLVVFAVRFLSREFNQAFSLSEDTLGNPAWRVDLPNFYMVMERLAPTDNLSTSTSSGAVSVSSSRAVSVTTSTATSSLPKKSRLPARRRAR